MSLTANIAAQEGFPETDITESNAGWLELVLANRQTLDMIHGIARVSKLCSLGHRAIREAGKCLESIEDEAADAFDLGIKTYEGVSACVKPRPPEYDLSAITSSILEIVQVRRDTLGLSEYLADAGKTFGVDLPNTRQTVLEVAQRFYPHSSDYAVYGAAAAFQLERRVAGA